MALAPALSGPLALLVALAFFSAAWGLGRLLVPSAWLPDGTEWLVRIGVGSGILGYAVFALGLLGWLQRPLLLVLLISGVGLSLLGWKRVRISLPAVQVGDSWLARGSAVVAAAALAFAMIGALLPEIEYDALWYHLNFPARYLRADRLLDLPCEHMSPVPQHVELLYGFGLLFGDGRGAKLIHFGFGLLTAVWTGWLARRWVGRGWSALAVALLLSAPTVLWEMTTAYNELPLAFLATGAVALLLEWRERGERRLLLLAAVLLGFGLAGKHLAYFFLAPLGLGVLLVPIRTCTRSVGRRLADGILFGAVAVATAIPWYVRAWVYTGNPLYPMFYDLLAGAGLPLRRWDAGAQQGWAAAMERYGDGRATLDLLLVPWRATWDGASYAGSLGPAWLLFLPLLLLFWRRVNTELRLLAVLGAIYWLLWISPYSSFQLRYLVPIVPVLAVLATAAVRGLLELLGRLEWRQMGRAVVGGVVMVLFLNLPLFAPLAEARAGPFPNVIHDVGPRTWLYAAGLRDPERYARGRLESFRAARWIDANLPADSRVVWFAEAADFYARQELLMDYSRCVAGGTWGAQPGQEAEAYGRLRAAGVTHVAWDKTRSDIRDEDFAIRSAEWVRRYAMLVYSDDVMEVYALRRSDGG